MLIGKYVLLTYYSVISSPSLAFQLYLCLILLKQEISELFAMHYTSQALKFSCRNPWLRSLKATQIWSHPQPTLQTLPYHGIPCFHLVLDAGLQILNPRWQFNSLTVYSCLEFIWWSVIKSLTLVLIPFSIFSLIAGASPIFPWHKSSFRTLLEEAAVCQSEKHNSKVKYIPFCVEQLELMKYKHLN